MKARPLLPVVAAFSFVSTMVAAPATAQARPAQADTVRSVAVRPVPAWRLFGYGVGGWVAGTSVGAGAGALVDRAQAGESFFPVFTAVGGFAGGIVGAPMAVHVANGRRGNFLLSLLSSATIEAGALGLSTVGTGEQYRRNVVLITLGTAALQAASAVAIERATSRRR